MFFAASPDEGIDMGVKVLHCFPWQRRCRECGRKRPHPLQAVPPRDAPVYLSPPGVAGVGDSPTSQVYLSHKAWVALRHQMDSNVIDATC